jgi:hypothetical protein
MKKLAIFLGILIAISVNGFAQVAINLDASPPNSAAMLDVSSTTKGFLAPRMTTTERNAITAVDGLLVYDTDLHGFFIFRGGSVNAWEIQLSSSTGWSTTGNSGTNPATNFVGTTDDQDLVFKVNNQKAGRLSSTASTLYGYQAGNANTAIHNTFVGWGSGKANTNSDNNIAIGYNALSSQSYNNGGTSWDGFNLAIGNGALASNQPSSTSIGIQNTAIGHNTLTSNTKGLKNTAIGYSALRNNTTAGNNVAIGDNALYTQSYNNGNSSYSTWNTAIGIDALFNNQPAGTGSSGNNNTAVGYRSLYSNTTGYTNVANGSYALSSNTIGPANSAIGNQALQNNTVAGNNVAVGTDALRTQSYSNGGSTFTSGNTAVGYQALYFNNPTDINNGIRNTAVGFNALQNNTIGYNNCAYGYSSLLFNTGNKNTAVGAEAFSSFGAYNNSTALGANAQITDNNQVRLGDDNITSLFCKGAYSTTTSNGPNLYVDNMGQIMRSTSGAGNGWLLTGNGSTNPLTNFVGTTDAQPLIFKTNGTEAMRIESGGDITVTANVDVNGKLNTHGGLFVGPNASGISSIITTAVAMDCPSLAAQASATVTETITGANANSVVFLSPQNALPGGIVIAHARISAVNTLEVKFTNAGSSAQDPPNMTFYVMVFY